jgi:LmbE family N-acetylglucosaminyl deacetylase
MKLLVAPHNDDEVLFGAFTLLREKPLVVIIFDGYVQQNRGLPITAMQRRDETEAACDILGVEVQFLGFHDDERPRPRAIEEALATFYHPEQVYAPAWEVNGHPQHNLVALACEGLPVVERYLTYTPAGKSTSGRPVPILDGSWIALKHRALACYESQMSLDPRMGCWPHFMRDQTEYYA